MKPACSLMFLAVVMLLAPVASPAQTGYNIQSLVKAGDTIAGVQLAPFNETDFGILGLNDNGELVFSALDTNGNRVLFDDNGGKFTRIAGEGDTIGGVVIHALSGGDGPTINGQTTFLALDPNFNDLLFQYAGGKTTLIAATGMPAPGGQFDKGGLQITRPVSMNWQGNIVFGAGLTPTVPYPTGILHPTQPAVFRWDAAKQQLTTVAGPGTKLGDTTVFSAIGDNAPVINNNNEMVIDVDSAPAKPPYDHYEGLVFVGADGKLQPITQYGQKLPDGKTVTIASQPTLNDAGVVAFAAAPDGVEAFYLWDKATGSTVGPIITLGQDAGGGHKVASIAAFTLDPDAANGLIQVRVDDPAFGPVQLYQYTGFAYAGPAQTAAVAADRAHVAGLIGLRPTDTFSFQDGPWNVLLEVVEITFDGFPVGGPKIVYYHRQRPNGGVPLRLDPKRLKLAMALQPAIDALKAKIDPLGKMLDDLNGQLVKAEMDGDKNKEDELAKQIENLYPQWEELMGQLQQLQQLQSDIATGAQPPTSSPTGGPAAPSDPPGPFFSFTTPGVYLGDVDGGKEAAFWIGSDRTIKLLLEDGMTTSIGKVGVYAHRLHWGSNADWNNYYQVALVGNVAAGPVGQDAILLLTPTAAP